MRCTNIIVVRSLGNLFYFYWTS